MRKHLKLIFGAAVAAVVTASSAAAVPLDPTYNHKNFTCEGCYSFSAVPPSYWGGDLGIFARFMGAGGGIPNLHDVPPVSVIFDYSDDTTLWVDTVNSAIYLTGEMTSRVSMMMPNHISYHGDMNVFRQSHQLYLQYTSGVEIQTDENGVPTDFLVRGMSPDNGGFILWNSGQFAAELVSKPNEQGLALRYDAELGGYAAWQKGGLMYYLDAYGNPIHEKGKYRVQADVMFELKHKYKPPVEEIPEPATALLLGSALVIGARRRASRLRQRC